MNLSRLVVLCFLFIMFVSGLPLASSGALIDNGDGTITDTCTNLMWLQDFNYAYTSGYDEEGLMNWYDAVTWAENLVYAGYDNWEIPFYSISAAEWDNDVEHLYHDHGVTFENPSPFYNINGTDPENTGKAYYWQRPEYDESRGMGFCFVSG